MAHGWRCLDTGITNANGPVVVNLDGHETLVVADTHASALYAYTYDGARGIATDRHVFADTTTLNAMPDGACADQQGAVWSCLLGAGVLACYTANGLQETIDTTVELPADVTFGGADLDLMFFVSISVPIGGIHVSFPNAGALMVITNSGHRGRAEPRFRL
jgi:sugar lactone lactonase YvrE